jgi:hypothetical protein
LNGVFVQAEAIMYPSEIRKRILEEHTSLRAHLRELEGHVHRLMHGAAELAAVAHEAKQLLIELHGHTCFEDAVLAPALRDTDAWGPQRADTMLAHHVDQRAELETLIADYDAQPQRAELVRMTLDLIDDIRSDMRHEEAEVLTRTLLRDDPIAIDLEVG